MEDNKSFIFYQTWLEAVELMSEAEELEYYRAIISYGISGELPSALSMGVRMAMKFVSTSIDSNNEKREAIKEKRREAGKNHKGNQYTRRKEQNGTNGTSVPTMEQNGTNGTINVNVDNIMLSKESTSNKFDIDMSHSEESDTASIHFEGLVEYWNSLVRQYNSTMSKINDIPQGTKRRDNVRARIKQYGKEVFASTLLKAVKSDFLNGRAGDGRIMNFDWIILPNNFIKVRDGNYDNYTTTSNNGRTNNTKGSTRESRQVEAAGIVAKLLAEDDAKRCR